MKARTIVKELRESDIETYLVDKVKAMGGEVRKVQWIGRKGAPDRLVMLPAQATNAGFLRRPARTIWVELKAPGKLADHHQSREHNRMRAMGQRVEVADSFKRVDEVLS